MIVNPGVRNRVYASDDECTTPVDRVSVGFSGCHTCRPPVKASSHICVNHFVAIKIASQNKFYFDKMSICSFPISLCHARYLLRSGQNSGF